MLYKTILADPPWAQTMSGVYSNPKNKRPKKLDYPTMSVDEICILPVAQFADVGCHLWLWTSNEFLEAGFQVMRAWGFKYLAPITWRKPSGMGNYFIHVTQTVLFGYKEKCYFNRDRYLPTYFEAPCPKRHSEKPFESYQLIERISEPPRLELFARPWTAFWPVREGWHVWGNEVLSDVTFTAT